MAKIETAASANDEAPTAQASRRWGRRAIAVKIRADANGIHLFDRDSGLSVLLDAVQVNSCCWAPAPRHISVALTDECDFDCAYCFAPKGRARLSMEQLQPWLLELDQGGTLGVGLGGGEPTLRRDLGQICEWCVGETDLAVTLTTHGHHVDAHLAEQLRGKVHFIRVSVDGHGATYEQMRGRSFPALLRALDAVATIAPFGISVLVNARSVGSLDALADLAADRNAQEILLLPERPVGGSGGIDADASRRLTEWVKAYAGPIRLATSVGVGVSGVPLAWPFPADQDGLTGYAHVTADGRLKRSSFDEEGLVIGESILASLAQLREEEAA